MNWFDIEQVLERFWEGKTSLEEEQELKHAFLREDLSSHLVPLRDYFNYTIHQKNIKHPQQNFEAQISEKLKPIKKPIFTGTKFLAYAASLLLVISSLFFLLKENNSLKYEPLTEKEMQVAQKYMGLMARNMELSLAISSNTIEKLNRLNSGASTLQHYEISYTKQIKQLNKIEGINNSFTQLKYLKTFKNSRIKL
jgi:hypothetical protein